MKANIMRALVGATGAMGATTFLAPPEAITQIVFFVLVFGVLFEALRLLRKRKPEKLQA